MNKKIFYLSKEDNFPQVDPDFFIGMPTDGGLYPALEEVVELAQEGDLVFMVFSGLLPTADDLSAWSEKLSDFDLISISSKEKCSFPRIFMPLPGLTGGSPHIVGFRVSLLEDYFSCTKTLPLKPRENTGLPLVVRLIFFKARVFSIMLETEISSPRGIGPAKLLSLIFSRRRHLRLSPYRSILHIVNIPWYSGLAAYAFDMSRQMKEMGIKTAFAASASSPLEKAVSDKEVFIPLLSRKGLGAFGSAVRISRLAKYYDFVAAHTGSSLFIALMAFRRPKRIIRLRAEGGSIKNNFFNLFLHRRLLKVIVPNKFTASFIPLEPEKIFLLKPLVDTELFSFSELPDENIIGISGRLDRVKGHYELINALPKI
ncbi:MAG: glycosyltransferase family 4 protein, partial [Elusimicrobia bacterium]|nr:glycosyltransferase family 4 protein [Elusimicrobiota bacterium]